MGMSTDGDRVLAEDGRARGDVVPAAEGVPSGAATVDGSRDRGGAGEEVQAPAARRTPITTRLIVGNGRRTPPVTTTLPSYPKLKRPSSGSWSAARSGVPGSALSDPGNGVLKCRTSAARTSSRSAGLTSMWSRT